MKAWAYLRRLSELPLRGSTTEGEREAAKWLKSELQALGYDVAMPEFSSPRHTLYAGPIAVIIAIAFAMILSNYWPVFAILLATASLIPLVGELLGNRLNFDLILPKRPSQNVVARPHVDITEGQLGDAKPNVAIVAHYDTQWGSWLFAPWFRPFLRPFFIVTYAGLVLGVLSIVFRWAFPAAGWVGGMTTVASILLTLTGAFLLGAWVTGRSVPGANDNGSGVAVALALAARWKSEGGNYNPIFVFTGCEEVGLRGMRHFLDTAELDPTTRFINIDNVGGGRLRYLLGEGMLTYTPYDQTMVEVAENVAERYENEVRPLKNLLLPTDGLLSAKAGYPTITFLAARDDNSIPEYHWHTDTLDNVDRLVVELTAAYLWDYLSALSSASPKSKQATSGSRG